MVFAVIVFFVFLKNPAKHNRAWYKNHIGCGYYHYYRNEKPAERRYRMFNSHGNIVGARKQDYAENTEQIIRFGRLVADIVAFKQVYRV